MTYITVDDVKAKAGLSDEISDTDIDDIISEVEKETEKFLNTRFQLTEKIDFLKGNYLNSIATDKNPILRVKELKVDNENISLDKIKFYNGLIKMKVGDDQQIAKFTKDVVVKYDYGKLNETDTTTTDADTTAGDTTISVNDESIFSSGDTALIKGTDGNHEAVKINSISTGQLTVDLTTLNHTSGSQVIKLVIDNTYKKLMKAIAGIVCATRMVGQTYTIATSYSIGELSTTKGVPYTHWQEVANKLIKERDYYLEKVKPQLVIK